jgi:hypothetical protein
VAINLLGTGDAAAVLKAFGRRAVIADRAFREVRRHPLPERSHGAELLALSDAGLLKVVNVEGVAYEVFFELVSANIAGGLDDGEAATIALAVAGNLDGIPVLDDRKARNVLGRRWPDYEALFTVDMLTDQQVTDTIAQTELSEFVFRALRHARMRVPIHMRGQVIDMIGSDRASQCRTLGSRADRDAA